VQIGNPADLLWRAWPRYHGVFAPHSALRAQVTPAGRGAPACVCYLVQRANPPLT